MDIVKLELGQYKGTLLADYAQNHGDAIAAKPEVFLLPDPAPLAFGALISNYHAASAAQINAQALAQQATKAKDAARLALEEGLRGRGAYVNKIAAGRPAIANLAGFAARAIRTPAPVPAMPVMLPPEMGPYHGSIKLTWKPGSQVRTYLVEMCADPLTEAGFRQLKAVTRSAFLVRDLVPGQKYWFRVAAVGSSGQSEWTDPVLKMVGF